MTSNYIEAKHELLLKQLIEEAGLECNMVVEESVRSDITEKIVEEEAVQEEQKQITEEVTEVEQEPIVKEEVKEEETAPFPSPSLRRMIPDKIRKIEELNRIRDLPPEFKKDIDPALIPKINQTPHQKYIDILAEMVGCKFYTSSMAEFWFLDTLANLLRRAQEDCLCRSTQALLILWFCEWMKEIEHFDAADRQRMLRRFKDNMLAAAKFIALEMHIPCPGDIGVHYKALEEMSELSMATRSTGPIKTHEPVVSFDNTPFECAMRDLTKITHYIFDLFSTDYQYELVRSVFCFSPDYICIDSPYQLQIPKRMYVPLRPKSKKEKTSPKKDKGKEKGKKRDHDTAEYLALMELKAKHDREFEEQEERIREELNLRNNILPLNFAATQELFDKFWPPPPPEPEPEVEPELKPKAKGKAKSDTGKSKK